MDTIWNHITVFPEKKEKEKNEQIFLHLIWQFDLSSSCIITFLFMYFTGQRPNVDITTKPIDQKSGCC